MTSNERKKMRKRSDRHQTNQPDEQTKTRKTRSSRHTEKSNPQSEEQTQPFKTKEHKHENKPKNRSERHQHKQQQVDAQTGEAEGRVRTAPKRGKFSFRFKHVILTLGALFVLVLIGYTTILYGGSVIVDDTKLPVSAPTNIEDTDGNTIWQIYDQYRKPVDLKDVPEELQGAFVATEDKRFYSHSGVDFRSIMRAIYKDIISRSKAEGASTITQQLAKNLFLSNDKSWLRKTKEVMIALYLEREYSKDEILEMYMNVVYFGQGVYGIEAASNKFFDKSVEDLSLEEASLLAGMVNAPNGYSPIDHPEKALDRRNLVLERMQEAEVITDEEKEAAQAKDIALNVTQRRTNEEAYQTFAYMVIKEAKEKYDISLEELKNGYYDIKTGFHPTAQKAAYDAFQSDSYFPGSDPATVEGAFVMMDEHTGEIAAALGGRHYQYGDLNRVTQMKRQPGSIMKPLAVFGPALETDDYNPYTMIPDEKQKWGDKEVKNADDSYEGEVNVYDALKRSKNTSAVWLLNDIGLNYAKSYLNKMDIFVDEEKDELNIALGGLTNGLTPLQLVQAYSVFGAGGEMTEAHTIAEIKDRKGNVISTPKPKKEKVFSKQTAWTMTEMMQGVVREGTAQAGYYPKALAGKTGTTQETNDIWFVGYTPEYVSAVWMGYDQPDEDHYLTGGSSSPTTITKQILSDINQQTALSDAFTQPENVQTLEEPIELPEITDLTSTFTFGGFKLLKGKLEWPDPGDDRITYRIYEAHENGEDEQIDEIAGGHEYVIDAFPLFQKKSYYIVPYDALGEREGTKSNTVSVSF